MKLRRNRKKVNPDNLHPVMAQGLTQGKRALEEAKELPDLGDTRDGADIERELREVSHVEGTRIPLPRFRTEDDLGSVWSLGDDRLQRNSVQVFPKDVFDAIRQGHICLRCNEPHPEAFPITCDLCGYAMKERQIMDVAMEFEGERHVGPAKPIKEYMEEKELMQEKIKFLRRQKDGGKSIVVPGGDR